MDRRNRVRVRRVSGTGAVAGALVASVLAASSAVPVAGGGAGQADGSIVGRVVLTDPPEPRMVAVTTDQAVCGTEVEDQAVVVDASGGLANAVVLVAGVPWGERPSDASIDNAGCYFVPRVQVLPTRTVVTIRSQDDTLHSTHAYDDRQRTLFNIAIPFPGLEVQRPMRRPGPVRIECDSHGWMRGWVYVSDDLGTVTGPDGTFELTGIPPGTYDLRVWHERYSGVGGFRLGGPSVSATREVTVTAGATVVADFTLD